MPWEGAGHSDLQITYSRPGNAGTFPHLHLNVTSALGVGMDSFPILPVNLDSESEPSRVTPKYLLFLLPSLSLHLRTDFTCYMPRPLWLTLLENQDNSLHIHLELLMSQGCVCFVFPGAGGHSGHDSFLIGRNTKQLEPLGPEFPLFSTLPGSRAQLIIRYPASLLCNFPSLGF